MLFEHLFKSGEVYSSSCLLMFTPNNLERQPLTEEWEDVLTPIEQEEKKAEQQIKAHYYIF